MGSELDQTMMIDSSRMRRLRPILRTSIFPHPASALWAPALLIVGWSPLFVGDLLYPPRGDGFGMGFAMAWGLDVMLPCTVLAAVSILIQLLRLLKRYFKLRLR